MATRKVSQQPKSLIRSEQAIFDELAKLCSSPGYIHAIAYLCFRDNMIRYSDEMKPEDMRHMPVDVLDFVENDQGQDLADAGHRSQAVKGIGY